MALSPFFHCRWLHKYISCQLKEQNHSHSSQAPQYSAALTTDVDVDVLEWWKVHAGEYPCLARIARDYLAIPATSAPAERMFSDGADLITKEQGLLREDTIQACIC